MGLVELLSENIRERRKSMGYTQAQFAKHIGLSFGGLQQIERGLRWPSAKTLKLIADGFQVDETELLRPRKPESIQSLTRIIQEQERELEELRAAKIDSELILLSKVREISPDQWEIITGLAKIIIKDSKGEEVNEA